MDNDLLNMILKYNIIELQRKNRIGSSLKNHLLPSHVKLTVIMHESSICIAYIDRLIGRPEILGVR